MRIRYWIAALTLVALVLAIEYDIARRTQAQIIADKRKPAVQADAVKQDEKPIEENLLTSSIQALAIQTFEDKFRNETGQIAQLQADPAVIEARLESFAKALTSDEIRKLSFIMQNPAQNGDERALAVELLARHKSQDSLQALEQFVAQHDATTKKNWSRSQEFESVIRAQAIEGIATFPQKDKALSALNTLSQKVDESFLLDRITRSSENVRGRADAANVQDDSALKKLIE